MPFEGARVLDVGFGRAYLLYCLQTLGAIAHGVDLDEQAVAYARALGLTHAEQGTIDSVAAGPYDLILMTDLVEHPLQPLALLTRARDLLGPRGLLLLSTPNGELADRAGDHTALRVDLEHMQYLTPRSCTYLASDLGLELVHLECLGFPALANLTGEAPRPNRLRAALRALPGFAALSRLRQRLAAPASRERQGAYRLLCILRKPA